MYSTIPTHETEEQALLAVRSKQPKRGGAVGVIVAAFILGVACVSVAPQSVSSAGDSLDAVALAAHDSNAARARGARTLNEWSPLSSPHVPPPPAHAMNKHHVR